MDSLFLKQERMLVQTSTDIIRELMNKIHWNNRLIAIRGSRGVGKTTLMLQYIKLNYPPGSRIALYCTLDSIYFSNHTLLELAEKFYLQGGKHLFLDEVHKYPTWSKELKEIYDLYPSLQVVFSGSSLLNILNADADLSRRCLAYNMYLLPHTRRVHQDKGLPLVGPEGIHRIPGGSHFIGHQGPFITEERIDEGGLAHIRTAHDGGADNVLRLLFLQIREALRNTVQKIPEIQAVHGRNTDGVPQSQGIELIHIHFLVIAVHLVHRQHHRLSRLPEKAGNGFIVACHTAPGIHHKQDDVRFFHGQLRLLPDAAGNLVLFIPELNAPRINQGEFLVQPLHITVNSISSHTGDVLHNRYAPLGQPVNQRRFAHVRPAYNGNERFTHKSPSFLYLKSNVLS